MSFPTHPRRDLPQVSRRAARVVRPGGFRQACHRLACVALLVVAAPMLRAAELDGGTFRPAIDELQGQTLFAFDNVSIPFTRSLQMVMRQPEKYSGNPVIARGQPGSADSWAIHFYGSVLKENGRYRMWYAAAGDERGQASAPDASLFHVCYAESTDGVNWTRPALGLVEYRGNKQNNIVAMTPFMGPINVKVLRDDAERDPQRRYKMIAHVYFQGKTGRHGTLAPYASPDGLNWKLLIDVTPVKAEMPVEKTVLPPVHFEPAGGFYMWDGFYYSTGQNPYEGWQPVNGRTARAYRSRDFVNWSATQHVNFVRSTQFSSQDLKSDGEQSHEGVSVWNRGNVLLGVYGQWHGAKSWPGITIDLGFVVSNDGLFFREPAHDWTVLKIGPDGTWDEGGLMQGQGFENVGDKTYLYYGSSDLRTWNNYKTPIPPRGGVGLAIWPRDRMADLRYIETGEGPGEFVTNDVAAGPHGARRLYLNADGLGAGAALRIELLGHDEQPLPGYSGQDAAVVTQSGFQVPLVWGGKEVATGLPARFRIRATFEGANQRAIRFSAIYVQDAPR